jgi:hypothetical protein
MATLIEQEEGRDRRIAGIRSDINALTNKVAPEPLKSVLRKLLNEIAKLKANQ